MGVCRQASEELKELAHEIVSGVNLTKIESLEKVKQALQGQPIDILIHNAGVLEQDLLGKISDESLMRQLEVNTLAPLMLTQVLKGSFRADSKLIFITSRMGSIADNDSGGYYGYRASKAALNAIGKSLAIDLKEDGVSVALLHPGFVRTRMTQHQGHLEPSESAALLKQRIEELSLNSTGKFIHANGEELPW